MVLLDVTVPLEPSDVTVPLEPLTITELTVVTVDIRDLNAATIAHITRAIMRHPRTTIVMSNLFAPPIFGSGEVRYS
jgi:hypothetical protein